MQHLILLGRWLLGIVIAAGVCSQTPPPAAACAVCTDRTVDCPACDEGTVAVPCESCGGDGKSDCTDCTAAKRGSLDCPNPPCRDGQVHWQSGETDPCRLCATKGRIPCSLCRGKAPPACAVCDGSGQRRRACGLCFGARRLPCPLCTAEPDGAGCGACDGAGLAACRLSPAAAAKQTAPCLQCAGRGGHVCAKCRGLDKVACTKCAATGKVRLAAKPSPGVPLPGGKAGVTTCPLCEGRALRNCPDCKQGRIDCRECERGQVPNGCRACRHRHQVACEDCLSGGYAREERYGDLLLAAGQPARAVLFFRGAVDRAKAMQGPSGRHAPLAVVAAEFERVRQAAERLAPAPAGPPAPVAPVIAKAAEAELPLEVLAHYWPAPPGMDTLAPWRDATWLAGHRRRVVARLEAGLAKAESQAAGK